MPNKMNPCEVCGSSPHVRGSGSYMAICRNGHRETRLYLWVWGMVRAWNRMNAPKETSHD